MRLRARSAAVHLRATFAPVNQQLENGVAHRVRDKRKRRSQKKGNIRRKLSKTLGEVTTLYQEKLTTVAICKFLPALRPTCLATPFAYCTGHVKARQTGEDAKTVGGREREGGQKTCMSIWRHLRSIVRTLWTNHSGRVVAVQRTGFRLISCMSDPN